MSVKLLCDIRYIKGLFPTGIYMQVVLHFYTDNRAKRTTTMELPNISKRRSVGSLRMALEKIFALIIILTLSCSSHAFNVDTKNTRIFSVGTAGIYFGYSLAMLRNQQGNWLLVGAPKANDPLQQGIREPGVLLRCSLDRTPTEDSCSEVVVDTTGNSIVQDYFYGSFKILQHDKTDQWLGVAVDVSPDNSKIMVCAHRWKDAKFVPNSDLLYMQGLCYELDSSFTSRGRLLPALVDYNSIVHSVERYPIWGYGMLGQSVQYSKTGNAVVMGAPGINDWQGGFVIEDSVRRNFTFSPRPRPRLNWMIGYTVTTTTLLRSDVPYIVAGAPRANLNGSVFIYEFKSDVEAHEPLIGDQLGSYFGSVICSADVNNDQLDDIIVGAPLYTTNTSDEGRVYVYLNRGLKRLERQKDVLNGSSTLGARFGSAIANIGDINKDSYNDIAIGAPYDDEGRGCLYIYNGYPDGVWPRYTQLIRARDIDNGLRTFGNAITLRSTNPGRDFAVGAFMSDRVVVLKARPVVAIESELYVQPARITKTGPYLEITPCFKYTSNSESVQNLMDITYTLHVDKTSLSTTARALIVPDYVPSIKKTLRITKGTLSCDDASITVFAQYQDIWRDVQLELDYQLSEAPLMDCVECPILESFNGNSPGTSEVNSLTKVVQYDKECGEDNICESALHVKVLPLVAEQRYIIAGADKWLKVKSGIWNTGENAYNIILDIDIVGNLSSAIRIKDSGDALVDCDALDNLEETSITTHRCHIRKPYPLQNKEEITFNMLFPLDNHVTYNEFSANFSVRTADEEIPMATEALTLAIKRQYEYSVQSISEPEQVTVALQLEQEEDWSDIFHLYSAKNLGPSPVEESRFSVFVPVVINSNEHLIKNASVKVTTYADKKDELCQAVARLDEPDSTSKGGYAVNVDCDTYTCQEFVCSMDKMEKEESIVVSVFMSVRGAILNRLKVRDTLNLRTKVLLPAADHTKERHDVTTVFHKRTDDMERRREQIPIWIVIVSVVSAFLVLLVIVAILIKVGFFRRSTKEEMKRLIESREQSRMSTTRTSGDHIRQSRTDMAAESAHANPFMDLHSGDDGFNNLDKSPQAPPRPPKVGSMDDKYMNNDFD